MGALTVGKVPHATSSQTSPAQTVKEIPSLPTLQPTSLSNNVHWAQLTLGLFL